MSKPNILIWCDSPTVDTGFGIVARNLFGELHKNYNVDIIGINYYGLQKYDHNQWHIYPIQKDDMLGKGAMQYAINNNKYEVIILFQDIFHISSLLPSLKEAVPNSKIISYFPIDGGPLFGEWKNVIEKSDKPITYTKYAINTISESFPDVDLSNLDYLYHGVSPEFKLLGRQERRSLQREFKWVDRFVAVNVNRYQPRKNISATVRAWSLFSKGYKLCSCGNAYPKNLTSCDANRCGPGEVVSETSPKDDVTLYLHMRTQEAANGPGKSNHLGALLLQNGFTQEDIDSNKIIIQNRDIYANPFTIEEMNKLYNVSCINISTAVGEGVGLSLIESAATGTTSIAPKNSAIEEMLEGHGITVKNVPNGIFTQPFDNNFKRPNVDTLEFVKELEIQYNEWISNSKKKIINYKALEAHKAKFQWSDKRDYLESVIKSLI
jgi:hypothetical protein